ncbi:DpnI domain-containing protein [Acidisphaera sp. S103]|uniref:DpnI domain-containing protein n=1 Tax=Acidisphaera sp. S103 TaxID=1747223 RepID=UPI00131DE602|nr:DpnI domain-containing protein [Acidisphaera sp. S103]
MNLSFEVSRGDLYKSRPQKIRNLSEHWVDQEVYCPSCGQVDIGRYSNNRPVADFFCSHCREDFELKSQGRAFGPNVADGAYKTMIERLKGNQNPNLLLLHYDLKQLSVINLLVIPKYFFIPEIIRERKPLSPTARRAGWIGCKIAICGVPSAGRISLIKDRIIEPREDVLAKWRAVRFLKEQQDVRAKGWILSVMQCIEKIKKRTFKIEELYQFEDELRTAHPLNRYIKEKIRQKLQVLRDNGYLDFVGRGTYRLVNWNPE